MKKLLLTLMLIGLLQGCGIIPVEPPIHPLRDNAIPDFQVKGTVEITNNQDNNDPQIVHSYGGTSWESNYKSITETMVEQVKLELGKHAVISENGADKSIGLKVTFIESVYIAFYWKGTMTYTVTLGNGEIFDKTVKHGTGMSAMQDLSGSIADGVVALFKDDRVKAYLAQ